MACYVGVRTCRNRAPNGKSGRYICFGSEHNTALIIGYTELLYLLYGTITVAIAQELTEKHRKLHLGVTLGG